ncbi:HNH endonuclease signature motif containing protein [Deinococcus fonticola]|uniref:HNH endonuclease signature motif containing protein n=1 Tax=Deinococcus fonticola TaxID=2528713 RepID=UPI001F0FC5B7|nr:HNH endonuclease signature motif containing protein [Deinococcus fonticola]
MTEVPAITWRSYALRGVTMSYKRKWDKKLRRQIYVHRLVAAQHMGRELMPGEVVHHRNGDKQDFSPENLLVLPSQAAHMAVEHVQRKKAQGLEPLFDLEDMAVKSGKRSI